MYYFYIIQNLLSGEVYNGRTEREPLIRWREHKGRLNNGYHQNGNLQDSWSLCGEVNFAWFLLDSCDCSEEEAGAYEESIRLWYKALGLSYNVEKCTKPSRRSRLGSRFNNTSLRIDLLSEDMLIKHKPRFCPPNKGIPMSEEQKRKISESSKGKTYSDKTKETWSRQRVGRPAWNKGVTHTEEHRNNVKEAWKTREKKEPPNKGTYSGTVVVIFGEEKTVTAWVHDERCQVSEDTLRSRLKKGLTGEDLITK